MPNVVFRPKVSERVPSKTFFAEIGTAPGPHTIGVTGDNSYDTLFGREWLLEWSVEDDMLRLYQESSTHPGEWERVLSPLPPVFDAPLPAGSRRVTFCFDQSARMVVAYEDEGVIKVTRWDPSSSQYVQNVSFAGVDPAVVMDATWAYDIPNSDVLIFYLSSDRTRVMSRVQRELYSVEHELWDYGRAVILDRALPAFLRYQLLVSEANGDPFHKVLISNPYPYIGGDAAAASAAGPAAGEYVSVVITEADRGNLLVVADAPAGGQYSDPLIQEDVGVEALDVESAGPTTGAYQEAILSALPDAEGIDGIATAPTVGELALVVMGAEGGDAISVSATGPTGGSYVEA